MATYLNRVGEREKLKPRRDPYWHPLTKGRALGYRRMTVKSLGSWVARAHNPEKTPHPYDYQPLGDFGHVPEGERYGAALAAAEAWFSHLSSGGAPRPGDVRSACEDYVEHLRLEKSESAADDTEGFYKRLVYDDPLARVDLAKATKAHFMAWRNRVLKASASQPSFNRNLTPLRAALNHAKACGKVASDQAWAQALKPMKDEGEKGGALRPAKPRENYLEPKERARLIENASDEGKAFFTVLRLLPLRPGDVANLKVEHFNSRHGTLSIPNGKTKRREILLSSEAAAHFRKCAADKLPGVWLIARADGSQWKKEAWRDEVKLAAAAAKLPRATVAYDLRHSTITDLVTGGLDLLTVAQLSGTSVAMIEKTYGKHRQQHARAALEALAKM